MKPSAGHLPSLHVRGWAKVGPSLPGILATVLAAAAPALASDPPGSLPSLERAEGADAGVPAASPLERAYALRADLETRRDAANAMLATLETQRFSQSMEGAGFNANKLLALRMEAIVELRAELLAQIRTHNDRIADLERQRTIDAPATGRTESKQAAPAAATDPFFHVTRASLPGTIQRRDLSADGRPGRATPTSLAAGTGDAVFWINANLRTFGQLLPTPGRSVEKRMFERVLDQFTGLCGLGRHGYTSFRAADGTFHYFRIPAPDEPLGRVAMPLTEAPVAMLAADSALVLVTPDRVCRLVRWASGLGASMFQSHLAAGTPLAAGTQVITAGQPERLLFIEPASRSWGRLAEVAGGGRNRHAIERLPLPEDGIPTGIAPARYGDTDVFYVTEAARDRIHRVRVADLRADSFQLQEGTRPAAIVPGPDGQVLFATATGFGCITPVGDIRRIPLKAQVQPVLLAAGRPGSGKLFFTDRQAPGVCSLNLAALGVAVGAGAGPAGLDYGEVFNGPSLLVGRLELKTQAQLDRARKKRKAQKDKARARAAEAAGAAEGEAEEGKAGTEPSAGDTPGNGAGTPTATEATQADDDPMAGTAACTSSPRATAAATKAEAKAEAKAESKAETKVEAKDESGASSDSDAEEPGGAKGILQSKHIARGNYRHVVNGHGFRKEPVLDPGGLAKSRFSEDLTRSVLGRFSTFKNYVLTVLREGIYRDSHRPDRETLVLDLAMPDPVGEVPAPGGAGWLPTRLLRMAVGTESDGTTFCLKSLYPIPESRGDSKEGKSAGSR